MKFVRSVEDEDKVFVFLAFLLFMILVLIFLKLASSLFLGIKSNLDSKISVIIEDIQNPQIISQHVNNIETKTFTLISTDDYYIGKGFIDGVLYYIFEVKEETNGKEYKVAPVADCELIYDGKNIVEVTKANITQKYKSRIDNQVKAQEITKYHYVFHLSNNKIKDYGVIQEKVEYYVNSTNFFFPMFIPFIR
ncbi:hypothetical protein [Caldanaerobacter subterraneus]|uniref:Uncharacterized protein n=1 Tax=Caldanaerobacter subterraneus TaxID=911092 RepID=A0A7Y2PL01_9THEO|nr:hypothetical protein [Caldanaerobacter subterraneus]NNG67554.1 hypothetical protein [Caldanaerobacter subterraneus]